MNPPSLTGCSYTPEHNMDKRMVSNDSIGPKLKLLYEVYCISTDIYNSRKAAPPDLT